MYQQALKGFRPISASQNCLGIFGGIVWQFYQNSQIYFGILLES